MKLGLVKTSGKVLVINIPFRQCKCPSEENGMVVRDNQEHYASRQTGKRVEFLAGKSASPFSGFKLDGI